MILTMLAIGALATRAPRAAAPTTPHAIVQSLYAPYVADPQAQSPSHTGSAEDQIRAFASKSLKHAIDADDACMKREQGICNIDFDILIAGQDWDMSHFSITDDAATVQTQTVHVRFDSGGPVEVRFYFVRQAGVWKIDDVEDLRPKDDPIRRDIRLKKQLLGQY
jgi:ABC-type transporter MlaC component